MVRETRTAPLAGLTVGCQAGHPAPRAAAWLLCGLGATITAGGHVDVAIGVDPAGAARGLGAFLLPAQPPEDPAGVPPGTVSHAAALALAAGALAAWRSHSLVTVPEVDVVIAVFLPPVMAAAYHSPTWPVPPEPTSAPGPGWLSCELGAAGDAERFATLLATLPPDASAADVAGAAREWRLAVAEYRDHAERPAGFFPIHVGPAEPGRDARKAIRRRPNAGLPLEGITVCDLTAMWAGPLASWLLGRLGATIHKVEPLRRVDGMRALDGRGVYPNGRQAHPGEDSALFNALNSGKRGTPLDLGRDADRAAFAALVQASDVVIDSFSPRVMPNLGLTRSALTGDDPLRLTVSMPAFAPGPLRPGVAYGTGVHALSGLGDLGGRRYASPAVTYPDPLAGLTAAVAVLAGLVGRDLGWCPTHLEVPLLSAIEPLLSLAPPAGRGPAGVAARDPGLGHRLLATGQAAGAFAPLPPPGLALPHPVGPFRVDGQARPLGPVARLEVGG